MTWDKLLTISTYIIAIAMVIFHLVSVNYMILAGYDFQNVHLAFALVLVFMNTLRASKRKNISAPIIIILILLSVFCTVYVGIFSLELEINVATPTIISLIIAFILRIRVEEENNPKKESFEIKTAIKDN